MTILAGGDPPPLRPDTLAARGGPGPDPVSGAVVPPICQSTTYAQRAVGDHAGYTYSRAHNPTVSALEQALAGLEGVRHAFCHATGMAAISALCWTVLGAGDHVVCSRAVYGGTVRLLRRILERFGVSCAFADTTDPDAVRAAVTGRTRLLLVESPANPTLELCDLAAAAQIARDAGALLAVDNTFLTAALQRPAELGADVVIYSTTKFIEGHGTTVGGAVLTGRDALAERLDEVRKTTGTIQSPFDAFLTLKGLRTLPVRVHRHSENALRIARWLEAHPAVPKVAHPWLESFPQHALARRQQAAGGGVLAFELAGGVEAGVAFMNALGLCLRAENLGAVETLVTHPLSMTHGDVPADQRAQAGITDGLVRLSAGLEDPDDVIADLEQALARAVREVTA